MAPVLATAAVLAGAFPAVAVPELAAVRLAAGWAAADGFRETALGARAPEPGLRAAVLAELRGEAAREEAPVVISSLYFTTLAELPEPPGN